MQTAPSPPSAEVGKPYHSREGQLADEQLCGPLVLPDLAQRFGAGPEAPLLAGGPQVACAKDEKVWGNGHIRLCGTKRRHA